MFSSNGFAGLDGGEDGAGHGRPRLLAGMEESRLRLVIRSGLEVRLALATPVRLGVRLLLGFGAGP
jgi:hypothetical protein